MLFGTGSAKFTRSGSEVLLENSLLAPSFVQRNIITETSVYDNYHTYEFVGDYAEFTVQLNLYKYTSPVAKYSEVYPYLYTYVHFWPHADGLAISGSNNEAMPFFIYKMEHSYLYNDMDETKDILLIHFKSIGYTTTKVII